METGLNETRRVNQLGSITHVPHSTCILTRVEYCAVESEDAAPSFGPIKFNVVLETLHWSIKGREWLVGKSVDGSVK